jgi:hypothetical protein
MNNGNKKPPVNLRGSAGGSNYAKDKLKNKSKPVNSTTTAPQQQPPTHEQVKKIAKSRINQTDWILQRLKRVGHVNTVEAYQNYILSPSACISTLRKRGHHIRTVKDYERMNGMATYHLIKQAKKVKP